MRLTCGELLEHKSSAYRDGVAHGIANAAEALDAVGAHELAELLRESIRPSVAAIREQAAELGVELTPWRGR